MLQQFGESNNGPFSGEQPRRGRHSLEVALGEIISKDPGVPPGLLYTAKEVIKRVESDQPTDQAQKDAAFLLQWLRQHANKQEPEPTSKPVFDPVAHQRSIDLANEYNLLHAGSDTTAPLYWTPITPQD